MKRDDLYRRLLAEINEIRLVDTHEHLISERARRRQKVDLFSWLVHYSSTDLVSAGMEPATLDVVRDPAVDQDERWALLNPYWRQVKNTGYAQVLLRAARELFEVPDIDESTWRLLSDRIAGSNREGWYHHVLKDRGNIEICVLDELKPMAEEFMEDAPRTLDRDLFAPVARFDDFVLVGSRRPATVPGQPVWSPGLDGLSKRTGVAIHSLDDLLRALDVAFEQGKAEGIVGVKCGLAYLRTLRFERATKSEAERVLNGVLSNYEGPDLFAPLPAMSWAELQPLQDYMMHQIVRRAIGHGLPIQVHTGIQEGNANLLGNSHPMHLANLLLEYPEARFVLLHAGYPYAGETAVLGKMFPNAYIDLCWVWAIGPSVAQRILDEWIDVVPANKILGFGGDYIFVEGTYASSRFAREGIARLLARRVRGRRLGEADAIGLARRILRENALQLFDLGTA